MKNYLLPKRIAATLVTIFAIVSVIIFASLITTSCKKNEVIASEDIAIVYFTKDITPEAVLRIYEALDAKLDGKIGVKIHFGAEGNKNFLSPALVRPLMEKTGATFVETNVLYVSKRRYTDQHIALAKEHGFTFAPIDILDADGEVEYDASGLGLKHYKKIKSGSRFDSYDSYIIYSHFKGHGSAGFGGAIKNLAMGFASPGGKMLQHAGAFPITRNPKQCMKCDDCVKQCPADAITITDNGPVIDTTKCIGCAKCIAECEERIFMPNNDLRPEEQVFLERLVEYAKVFATKKKMVYINVLANISSACDCSSRAPKPFMGDVGILASTDIVAIEKASHDLISKAHKCEDAFKKEVGVSGLGQVLYAEKLKMGTSKYKLIELDKKKK